MAGSRPQVVAVRRVARRRPWLEIAVSAVASGSILGLVALGALGRDAPTDAPLPAASAATAPGTSPAPSRTGPSLRPRPPAGIGLDQALVVTTPGQQPALVVGRAVTVSGYVVGPAADVRVTVRTPTWELGTVVVVEARRSPDLLRPQRAAPFEVTLDVGDEWPDGRLIVEAELLARDGTTVDLVRREVVLDSTVPTVPSEAP